MEKIAYPMKQLEAFFAVLITTMAISFGFEYGVAKPDQAEVIYGILVWRVNIQTKTDLV